MKILWQRTVLVGVLTLMSMHAFAAQQTYRLRVDGLACPFCAYGLEKKLNAVKGVEHLEVDVASGLVKVSMTEGATLDEAAAKKAVKEAGFTLRGFEQAPAK